MLGTLDALIPRASYYRERAENGSPGYRFRLENADCELRKIGACRSRRSAASASFERHQLDSPSSKADELSAYPGLRTRTNYSLSFV